ncbi:hypothetical protein GCM10009551_042520 [Nocardiopsis tropica]
MGVADDVGTGEVEDVVASLVALELVEVEIVSLEHGAHSSVRHEDASGQCFTEGEASSHVQQLYVRAPGRPSSVPVMRGTGSTRGAGRVGRPGTAASVSVAVSEATP